MATGTVSINGVDESNSTVRVSGTAHPGGAVFYVHLYVKLDDGEVDCGRGAVHRENAGSFAGTIQYGVSAVVLGVRVELEVLDYEKNGYEPIAQAEKALR